MKYILTLIIATGIGIGYYFSSNKMEIPAESSKTFSYTAPKMKATPRQPLKEIKYLAKTGKKVISIPNVCQGAMEQLGSTTFNEFKNMAKNRKEIWLFFGKDCVPKLIQTSVYQKLGAFQKCRFPKDENEKVSDECYNLLYLLKSVYISEQSHDKEPKDMDEAELASNVINMYLNMDKLETAEFQENLKTFNEFYQRHSDDPKVIEAYLGYLLIGGKITDDENAHQTFDQIMDHHRGDNFSVDRLEMIKAVIKQDFESAKMVIDGLAKQYPSEPDVDYYYAAHYWKHEDSKKAFEYLDKAIASKKSGVYTETKKQLQKTKPGDTKPFSISIGLNFQEL